MREFLRRWRQSEHDRLREQLSSYLDGRLAGSDREKLEAHLETCEACRSEFAGLRMTVQLLRDAPVRQVPRSFTLPLAEMNRRRQLLRQRTTYALLRVATAVCTAALALVLSSDVYLRLQLTAPSLEIRGAPSTTAAEPVVDKKRPGYVEAPQAPLVERTLAPPSGGGGEMPLALRMPTPGVPPASVLPPSLGVLPPTEEPIYSAEAKSSSSADLAPASAAPSPGTEAGGEPTAAPLAVVPPELPQSEATVKSVTTTVQAVEPTAGARDEAVHEDASSDRDAGPELVVAHGRLDWQALLPWVELLLAALVLLLLMVLALLRRRQQLLHW